MAAKKTTSTSSASKGKNKPSAKSAKPAKKAAAKKPAVKKAAATKVAPVKKAAAKKTEPPKKAAAKKVAKKPKSSLGNFPAAPAPKKEPFVPPQAKPPASAARTNGHHSAPFIRKQHQRLLDLRDDLVDAMSGMTRDTIRNAPEGSEASGSGQHQGDAGSDAYDRDFALSVLAKEQDALYEIEQALKRIERKCYGICEMSAEKIPQTRLEAIPFARLTVDCQAQWEKEYGNRRFRPSHEVGFSGGKSSEDEDSDTVSLDGDED